MSFLKEKRFRTNPHGLNLPRLQISNLQSQIHSQESDLQCQEEELSRAKADLGRLQQEESQLEQSLAAGKIQLETIIKSLKATQDEINQVGNCAKMNMFAMHEVISHLSQYITFFRQLRQVMA